MRSNLMLMEPMAAYDWHRRLAAIELDAATRVSTEQIRDADQVAVSIDRNIAFLRIHGVIEKRLSLGGFLFGGTSTEAFGRAFQSAVDDSSIKGIVVSIDSPGGRYPGTPELAQQIYEQRGAKGRGGIVAVADTLAASGALWLGTAFDEFVIAPSGEAGSLGAFVFHQEISRALQEAGVTTTITRKPEGKADRNLYEPLTEAARAEGQKIVDEIYEEFVEAVARHRGKSRAEVEANFGRGRMMSAREAVGVGMCDGVATLAEMTARLVRGRSGQKAANQQRQRRMTAENYLEAT